MATVSKEQLISDLQRVDKDNGSKGVTRDFYRKAGKYSDAEIAVIFSTYTDFCAAAGINQPTLTSEVNSDTWSVFIPNTEFCTADEVASYCKVDLATWELERFRAKDVSKSDEGPRFQISAFFRRRKDILAIRAEIEDLKNEAKRTAPVPNKIKRVKELTGNMLEIGIFDLHMGKLAYPPETGHEPYDIQIAQAMFERALEALIERSKGLKWDKILFTVGNDLLNSDNVAGTTTRGTLVSNDVRYHKVFRKTRAMIVSAIERLRTIAPVLTIVCPGNHDNIATFSLGDSLECWFAKYDDVEINNEPCSRKYVEWGKVMLMFCHGDSGDKNDYPLLIATEQPEMFGRTKFREVHTGHTHQTRLDEKHGVRVRVLPSLSPPDAWHAVNGYTQNLRNAEAYHWNKNEGLVGMAIYNDDCQPPLITKRALI